MINIMNLRNFKCFQDQAIVFRPLTLLTGVNSAGKSTVIQALLLLKQNWPLHAKEPDAVSACELSPKSGSRKLRLAGRLVNLGLYDDVLSSNANDDSFLLELKSGTSDISLRATPNGDGALAEWSVSGNPAFENFQYLNANRVSSQTLFPVPQIEQFNSNPIGNNGEFAAYHLYRDGQANIIHADPAGPNLLAPQAPGDSISLQIQAEAWLSQLGSPARIHTDRPAGTDTMVLRFSFPDISGNYYRPTNVGFGLAYTLPIFVAALRAPVGSLLIVENPEAHLHPRGQALMGHFLARAAACGVQVIVETHSDHVLNGIRVAAKQALLFPDNVQINFFCQRDGKSAVTSPSIDRDGHIDEWPEDFFDEWDKQLAELL